jgi:hypothetical protein
MSDFDIDKFRIEIEARSAIWNSQLVEYMQIKFRKQKLGKKLIGYFVMTTMERKQMKRINCVPSTFSTTADSAT